MGTESIGLTTPGNTPLVCTIGDEPGFEDSIEPVTVDDVTGNACSPMQPSPADILLGFRLRDRMSQAPSSPLASKSPLGAPNPAYTKSQFDREHVYSDSPAAAKKRAIDLSIMGGDYGRGAAVRLDNAEYLKALIAAASDGKTQVGSGGPKDALQFFIIRGGAEGFLPSWAAGEDASNHTWTNTGTDGKTEVTRMDFDDAIAVFDGTGNLVSAARLERPLEIPQKISQTTADKVYDAWPEKPVIIYRNTTYDIPYIGLGVQDGHRGGDCTIDMHKHENTNGCIFIDDSATPALGDEKLKTFEPKLLKDVIAAIGKPGVGQNSAATVVGKMHVVKIH